MYFSFFITLKLYFSFAICLCNVNSIFCCCKYCILIYFWKILLTVHFILQHLHLVTLSYKSYNSFLLWIFHFMQLHFLLLDHSSHLSGFPTFYNSQLTIVAPLHWTVKLYKTFIFPFSCSNMTSIQQGWSF